MRMPDGSVRKREWALIAGCFLASVSGLLMGAIANSSELLVILGLPGMAGMLYLMGDHQHD